MFKRYVIIELNKNKIHSIVELVAGNDYVEWLFKSKESAQKVVNTLRFTRKESGFEIKELNI